MSSKHPKRSSEYWFVNWTVAIFVTSIQGVKKWPPAKTIRALASRWRRLIIRYSKPITTRESVCNLPPRRISTSPNLSARLFNIIFIHSAPENQSLNPQLSQLLWIIQYNFYSSLPWKITFQPSTFSTFSTHLFSVQNQLNQLEKVEKVEGWRYHFVWWNE